LVTSAKPLEQQVQAIRVMGIERGGRFTFALSPTPTPVCI